VRILISAYACEPDKGSEPGAGWNWACAAARDHHVWVMTRANNQPALEAALEQDPNENLHFVYLDLPRWARFWKRRGRGVRSYYLLWQLLAARESRRLHRKHHFDIVHHLTFANVWLPALVCVVDAPFVLGPVGGGPRVPLRLFPALGMRGILHELLRGAARQLSRLNPLVRISWKRADLIVCQNAETRAALPKRHRAKALIQSNASVQTGLLAALQRPKCRSSNGGNQAIYAGRLAPWKGLTLAIRAVALTPGWRLVIVGDGSDRARLEILVRKLGVGSRVAFRDWCPQEALWELLRSSDVLLLPSLREDASFVAAEACTLGVSVIAFDQGGPAVLRNAGLAPIDLIGLSSVAGAIDGLVLALRSHRASTLESPKVAAADALFAPPATVESLRLIYGRLMVNPVLAR
jgi:glycosyltransferase involved in cell wall biosynthesis